VTDTVESPDIRSSPQAQQVKVKEPGCSAPAASDSYSTACLSRTMISATTVSRSEAAKEQRRVKRFLAQLSVRPAKADREHRRSPPSKKSRRMGARLTPAFCDHLRQAMGSDAVSR